MENKIYAVIDTNVLVSALLTSEKQSNPLLIFQAIIEEKIVPLFCDEILEEYREVLSRDKFPFTSEFIDIKHFPKISKVVTPAEMVTILDNIKN